MLALLTDFGRTQRTPTDWVGDETSDIVYILMKGASDAISDQLVRYDRSLERHEVLDDFYLSNDHMLQITSTDYDTFYLLSEKQIYTYTVSTSALYCLVDSDSDYPVQTDIHYDRGVDAEDQKIDWDYVIQ